MHSYTSTLLKVMLIICRDLSQQLHWLRHVKDDVMVGNHSQPPVLIMILLIILGVGRDKTCNFIKYKKTFQDRKFFSPRVLFFKISVWL